MTKSAVHRDLRGATEVPRTDSSGERCRASRSQGRAAEGVPVKWSAQAEPPARHAAYARFRSNAGWSRDIMANRMLRRVS
jgi:hypothetical protein